MEHLMKLRKYETMNIFGICEQKVGNGTSPTFLEIPKHVNIFLNFGKNLATANIFKIPEVFLKYEIFLYL